MAIMQKEKPVEISKEVLDAARNIDMALNGKEKLKSISANTVKELANAAPTLAGMAVAANKNLYDNKTVDYVKGKLNTPEGKEIAKYL